MSHRILPLFAFAIVMAAPLAAQLVTPKTVPVLQDEQFSLYPTSRPGMSGVSIAIDDTTGDLFVNPAKAARLRGVFITSAPYSHSISGSRGGGRTVPIAVLFGTPTWSGAAFGAMQELDRTGPSWNLPTSERKGTNQYYSATLARSLANGLAIGVSAFRADLSVVDGVDLLYPGSDRIAQSGSLTDLRLGATKEWEPGHVLELMLLRNRTHMRHDVHFTTWTWDATTRMSGQTQRAEVNLDETNIVGAHTKYVRPVGHEGWRVGVMGTANHLDHPKIPNYVLQNVPRDPGTTNAFAIGVGAGREVGPTSFAAEFALEPMSSSTWADMTTNFTRTDGSVIPAGQRTVENDFRFRNGRGGISGGWKFNADTAKGSVFTFNFGLSVNSISYDLRQTNNMTRTVRNQHEHWVEAGPSFGLRIITRDVEFSYAFRSVCGSDCAENDAIMVFAPNASTPETGGIIAAPSGPLRFQTGRETSHHFTISIPIR